ncbi:hypothetical protein MGALJ_09940 [Mycobacterium gallinarum]|uniref:Uncharacterized protein n=1 Tax=Mycobacterium gallinarum TaxID=39689 RepID=A0A9W4B5F9_9MYCO|nr:hypothetical protein [Mycobacterium gallinarum]BBY91325.1 hypothetical protein MGALJ_09940 [Mycobacterium gallinarum]
MCETRKGVVTVPNTLGPRRKAHEATAAALKDAASQLADNEQLIAESVRLDGTGTARWSEAHEDYALMDFPYTYTVMVPGCTGWSRPVT